MPDSTQPTPELDKVFEKVRSAARSRKQLTLSQDEVVALWRLLLYLREVGKP